MNIALKVVGAVCGTSEEIFFKSLLQKIILDQPSTSNTIFITSNTFFQNYRDKETNISHIYSTNNNLKNCIFKN